MAGRRRRNAPCQGRWRWLLSFVTQDSTDVAENVELENQMRTMLQEGDAIAFSHGRKFRHAFGNLVKFKTTFFVISVSTSAGSTPDSKMACCTSAAKSLRINCSGDTLTAIRPGIIQSTNCRQAPSITNLPRGESIHSPRPVG
jgi:predicted  nucleic acid-binding Zn ribbon protein